MNDSQMYINFLNKRNQIHADLWRPDYEVTK